MYTSAKLAADVKALGESGYFDPDWYLDTYRDVNILRMDPAEHYLKYGAVIGRDPGPGFSTRFYCDTNPGRWQETVNPVLHHVKRSGKSSDIQMTQTRVLLGAFNLSRLKGAQAGVDIAKKYLAGDLAYTATILKANQAVAAEREDLWLKQVNTYLRHYDLEPLRLKTSNTQLMARMTTRKLAKAKQAGPLVSVIMPVWNAANTVRFAASSILKQTWGHIELLMVDDVSTDKSWAALQKLAREDSRIKILRNTVNSGPYVAKNIALSHATGDYITRQASDDWAHPQRIENHLKATVLGDRKLRASTTYMLRMRPDGHFGFIVPARGYSLDGVARKGMILCLFERDFLMGTLGFWDSVRFGGDSEMISRAKTLLGDEFDDLPQISMLCLDMDTSLTNHPQFGLDRTVGLSPTRMKYRDSWQKWHAEEMSPKTAYLPFVQNVRRYDASADMAVPVHQMQKIAADIHDARTR